MASRRCPSSSQSETSFLSLPPPVRRRIYALTGLVRFCPIDLNHEGPRKDQYLQTCADHLRRTFDGWEADVERRRAVISPRDAIAGLCCFYRAKRFEGRANFPGPDGIDCVCGPLPTGLLLVCRDIYAEVVVTLYSENQFKICRTAPGGLTALSRMGVDALQVMTRLHVRLNACGCVPGHVCSVEDRWAGDPFFSRCPSCHHGCKCGKDLPLSSRGLDTRTVVREWKRLTRHLATRLTSHRVRLSVVCDTLDHATAQRILQPIQRLPLLTSCAIRLGQRPDPSLRLLAETAVRQATGQPRVPGTSFRWGDLPQELQLRVLRHSGLVAASPLEWTEGNGLEKAVCCQQCTDTLETCCCPSLHAAFTSLGCRCWQWPRDHFLVNKAFRQQALQIVYNLNTFSVATLGARAEPDRSVNLSIDQP